LSAYLINGLILGKGASIVEFKEVVGRRRSIRFFEPDKPGEGKIDHAGGHEVGLVPFSPLARRSVERDKLPRS
jgi:hypothetical protein